MSKFRLSCSLSVGLVLIVLAAIASAQDGRGTVPEPTFPTVCTTLYAQLPANLNGVDQTDSAKYDTTRIQNAISGCTSGAVELAPSGSNVAFLSGALQLSKSNVSLIIDAGVTLYASRRPADYDQGSGLCGKIDNGGSNCNAFIRSSGKSGVGIYGYGVIDGQGGQPMLTADPWYCYSGAPTKNCSGYTWWQLADYADTLGLDQNVPRLINTTGSMTNTTLYKVTLQNSPKFHAYLAGNGITLWGVKITTPWTAANTDGFDPTGATNVTMTNSYVSTGDDNVAIKAASASSAMTFSHNHFYAGHGMSIGSETNGGLSNVSVTDLVMAGNAADTNQNGLRIKSDSSRGGLVQNVVYDGVCMKDTDHPLVFDPYYSSSTGSLIPKFQNITVRNTHIVNDPSFSYYSGSLNFVTDGYSSTYPLGITFDNVVLDQPTTQGHFKAQYANITLGPGPVSIASNLASALPATGVSITNSVSNSNAPYDCTNRFIYLAGDLFYSSNSSAIPTITASQSLKLNVVLQPAVAGDPLPQGTVTIMDGSTSMITVPLSTTGWITPVTVTGLSVGSHTLSVHFSGDSITTKYIPMDFGAQLVTVNPDPVVDTTTVLAANPTSTSFGSSVTLTATVTAIGMPTGSVTFYDGATSLGSSQLNGSGVATFVTASLTGGLHSLTASYAGATGFNSSSSPVQAVYITAASTTTTLVASPASVYFGSPLTLTATVTASAGVPGGSVNFYDGGTQVGSGTLNGAGQATFLTTALAVGTHTLTASYVATTSFATSNSAGQTVNVLAALPSADSVTPNNLTGTPAGPFVFKFSDGNGASSITFVQGIIGTEITYNADCSFNYSPSTGQLYVNGDKGGWQSPIVIGTPGTLSNSACSIDVGASSASMSGNSLTLSLAITFAPGWSGQQNIYGLASEAAVRGPWQLLGTWTATTAVTQAPTILGVTPASVVGPQQTFAFQYSSVNGYSYISWVQGIINADVDYAASCSFFYLRATNNFYIQNDAGTGWIGPKQLGAPGTLANSQCTIDLGASSSLGSGNNLTLSVAVREATGILGLVNLYSIAVDRAGLSSGWMRLGTWTPNPAPAIPPSATPLTIQDAVVGTPQILPLQFSSPNGGAFISWIQAIIGGSFGYSNNCSVFYNTRSKALYLMNDAGTAWSNPLTLGSTGTLQNSQCSIDVGGSTAGVSGNNFALNLAATFKSGTAQQPFTGATYIWEYAVDKANLVSNWQYAGTFNLK